ncbi:unnamed protein product [Musa textilis]
MSSRSKVFQIVDINSDPGPHEIQCDEWLAITQKFDGIFPLSQKIVHLRPELLDKQDYRERVRNKLNTRRARPFDFVQLFHSLILLSHSPTTYDAWSKLSDDGKYAEVGDVDELEELAKDENEGA